MGLKPSVLVNNHHSSTDSLITHSLHRCFGGIQLMLIREPSENRHGASCLLLMSNLCSCIMTSWIALCLFHKSKSSLRTGIQFCVSFAWPQNITVPCYRLVTTTSKKTTCKQTVNNPSTVYILEKNDSGMN